MTAFSSDDRRAICDIFDRLLETYAHEDILRKTIESEAGFDANLWQKMAALGLTAIMVERDYGGLGGGLQEAEALMEIAGQYLYCGPFLSSCILAPTLLQASSDMSTFAPYLKDIASGASIFAVAGCGESGDWTQNPSVNAVQDGERWTLTGASHFVTHALKATHSLVFANKRDERGVFLVDMQDVEKQAQYASTNDPTLKVTTLGFKKTKAIPLKGVDAKDIDHALHTALVAFAGDQVGATRRIFELTLDYLNTRYQFGQPIGRFQALKHRAAELLIEVESSSTVARHAAKAIANISANTLADQSRDGALLTYLAAFTCADNFRTVAAEAIQLHGGIAYTMEHPAHLYWRRAQTGQWLFGSSDRFRDLYLSATEAKL